jgi:tryptophan 2,3-dioxygenase
MNEKINSLLEEIKKQYQFQNDKELETLLEGLANTESKGITYWDYIEVDTLLSLQKTKTDFPDEVIFIAYHQIHELYFKLIIQELEKIVRPEKFKVHFIEADEIIRWQKGLQRVTRYMNKLIGSFDILKFGLDRNEFGVFRKSLLPASGFQTHQFRLIEIMLTSFENLIKDEQRKNLPTTLILAEHFENIYWRSGAIEKSTGKPAKILVNFNNKYDELFMEELNAFTGNNLYSRFLAAPESFRNSIKEDMVYLEESMLMWKIAHLRSVQRHIPIDKAGTGGTKWDEYLPVTNQKIYYFPEFWKGKDINEEIDRMSKEYPERMLKELNTILK